MARLLRERGVEVIDADQVAREIVEPGRPALAELVAEFGPAILDGEGRLDRKRLGAIVFGDEARRRRLNAITHPRIAAETARRTVEAGARGIAVVVYEAALLVENGIHRALDGLIVVSAPPAIQLARAVARDGITVEEAGRRLDAQLPLADKVAAADYVIDNAGPPGALDAQVDAVWRDILDGGPRRRPRTDA